MKCIIGLILFSVLGLLSAYPAQKPWYINSRRMLAPQKLMYVQYRHPSGHYALLGADTYVGDEETVSEVDLNLKGDRHETHSVAVANPDISYIAGQPQYPSREQMPNVFIQPDPNVYESDSKESTNQQGFSTVEDSFTEKNDESVTQISPTLSPKVPVYQSPKKKVHVDLEELDYNNYDVPVYPDPKKGRKPNNSNNNNSPDEKPNTPAMGTFFPVYFGESTGSAIAIANSFSTGASGSATSHAIAYGNPNPNIRFRKAPTRAN